MQSVDQAELLYQRGVQAFVEKRYHAASEIANAALALDASLAGLHFLLGSAELEIGAFGKAEQALSACIALQPGYPLIQHAQMLWARSRVDGLAALSTPLQKKALGSCASYCVSIIICSIHPERFSRVSAQYHRLFAGVEHEIVGIHDAVSLCEGYNRGIRQAVGNFLIFSHDDIEIVTSDFAARVLAYLDRFDVIGVAGTTRIVGPAWVHAGWPYIHGQVGYLHKSTGQLKVQVYDIRGECTPNAQAMDGVFLAARREVAQRVGFDESVFTGWHLYDMDFTYSAYLAGYQTVICHDLCLVHDSSGHWGDDWQRYASAFMAKHGAKLMPDLNAHSDQLCTIDPGSKDQWLLMTQVMAQVEVPHR